MGMFLNSRSPFGEYSSLAGTRYFVDKSAMIDEIFYYIRNNIEDVRDDLAMMVSGERIEIELQGYAATNTELKVDSTPEKAILQIKDKGYALRFKGKMGETPKYTGRILAVGISYDRKTKEHSCKVEVL